MKSKIKTVLDRLVVSVITTAKSSGSIIDAAGMVMSIRDDAIEEILTLIAVDEQEVDQAESNEIISE